MRVCNNCGIEVGGITESCPLCQGYLSGEDSQSNWPSMNKLKKQAFFYKLQLFIVLACALVGLGLDFLLDLNDGKHWSLLIMLTAVVIEIMLHGFLKKIVVVSKIVNISVLNLAFILVVTAWYYNFLRPVVYIVIPIIISAALVTNLVLSFVDKSENAMVYMLTNVLVAVVPYIFLFTTHYDRTIPWTICFMISIVAFLGMVIFKGRKVLSEVQKRMNF